MLGKVVVIKAIEPYPVYAVPRSYALVKLYYVFFSQGRFLPRPGGAVAEFELGLFSGKFRDVYPTAYTVFVGRSQFKEKIGLCHLSHIQPPYFYIYCSIIYNNTYLS